MLNASAVRLNRHCGGVLLHGRTSSLSTVQKHATSKAGGSTRAVPVAGGPERFVGLWLSATMSAAVQTAAVRRLKCGPRQVERGGRSPGPTALP